MARNKTSWKPGQSGNPTGRNGREKLGQLRKLLDPHAAELVIKAKDMALDGDTTALRLCLERLVPAVRVKDDPVCIDGLHAGMSLSEQGGAVITALVRGDITPMEAASVMQSIASQARIVETDELEERISRLELANGS